jgi:TolB protein
MNADGTSQTNLTDYPGGNDADPAWSPDGTRIAFVSGRAQHYTDVYVMGADGTGQIRLTESPGLDSGPAWSPDGSRIAFVSEREGALNPEIYVMNADGTGQTNLANNSRFDQHPTWSPGGSQIAFASGDLAGNPEIYVMNADGTGQTNLTDNPAFDADPAWSPDGQHRLDFSLVAAWPCGAGRVMRITADIDFSRSRGIFDCRGLTQMPESGFALQDRLQLLHHQLL